MTSRHTTAQQILGWAAIALSTLLACFWAFWGINENFHEGWFSPSLLRNLALMVVQYLSPMLIVMLISVAALRWPTFAFLFIGTVAVALAWFLRRNYAALGLILLPLLVLAALYQFGRPQPQRWAWRVLIGPPLITLVACGAWPAWMAFHRFDDGNYGTRTIVGNGVILVWAPEGRGWPSFGVSWYQANHSCAFLAADGLSLADRPQHIWRLPTTDEVVRSLVFRGANAGGVWDAGPHRAHYRVAPEKDSPLWKVHAPVIYWWTASESGPLADYVSYNGFIQTVPKRMRPGSLAFRCVRDPHPESVPAAP